jgi:hypothetical protein
MERLHRDYLSHSRLLSINPTPRIWLNLHCLFGILLFFSVFKPSALAADAAQSKDFVWWEGESPAETNFPKNNPFGPRTLEGHADLLSGGNWLNTNGKGPAQPLFAKYKVAVPADGTYRFWVRKFWKHGPFRWRFDSFPAGEWRTCGPDVALADRVPIKKFVEVNWVSLGQVELKQGEHTFELELITEPGKEFGAAFDCFVLSRGPFVPNGKVKPGERAGKADEGFFPFEPPIDRFTPDALLDLRGLNEKSAGETGFLKHVGNDFALGDGRKVRFWAVNVGSENAAQDRASVDYLARKLAKLGVNMVRFHSALWDPNQPAKINPKALDDLFYLEAALKKQGIYTYISFYFPVWMDASKSGFGDYAGLQNKHPFALLYFDPQLQQMHRGWAKAILDTRNPYTGTTLARDPAVGIVEMLNEDSFFFWTFGKKNIPPGKWQALEDLYAKWLAMKYGSVKEAYAAWDGTKAAGDTNDRPALYEAFEMTANGVKAGGGKAKRVGDQVRFLAELQRRFYADTARYLKEDLHLGGLVNTSNWTVADANLTGAIERWTYTAGDLIDAHGYFEGEHKGEGAAYSVRTGHTFKDAAAVQSPTRLPLRFQQIDGYPQIISEIGFNQPNRYRADGVFLTSAYGALQGVDGVFFFAVGSNYLLDNAMNKFAVSSPAIAGAFPAAALVYRRGDVKEAPPAVYQVLDLKDLFAMKGSGGWSADALDAFRKQDLPPGATVNGAVSKMDELAPYVGPVVRAFGSDTAKSYQRDLSKFIDREHKTVTSLSGELKWNYADGLATMNTARAQGAAGFLAKAGAVATENLRISLQNEFGTVTAVSLDDQPIASSKKILLQVMTQEQPTGFKAENGTITALGGAPFGVRKIQGTVEFKLSGGGAAPVVTALDENGYPSNKAVNSKAGDGGAVQLPLLEDVVYYVIGR